MLLVVDNGSIYTKNLIDFLSEKKVKFVSQKADDVSGSINEMLDLNGPVFLLLHTDRAENVFPMIPSGAAHNEIVLAPKNKMKVANDKAMA